MNVFNLSHKSFEQAEFYNSACFFCVKLRDTVVSRIYKGY